jgi:PAS domain S-box-containing protein
MPQILLLISIVLTIVSFATLTLYRRRLRDIRTAVQELRSSESRFRRLFENVLEGVYQTSSDGHILIANPALVRMLGYQSEEEFKRVNVEADLYARPEERAVFLRAFERDGELRNVELRLRRKDGEVITVLENGRRLTDPATGQTYYEGTLTDITGRKRAEQELRNHARKLEQAQGRLEQQASLLVQQSEELRQARDAALEASRLKSEFLANVSHEIRTPMNGVIGMTSLLLETNLSDEQRDYATTVRRSAEFLLSIINDILDFSKVEAGRMSLQRTGFSLRQTVAHAMQLLAHSAAQKGIELSWSVDDGVPDALRGDAGRLSQVLINLAGNAIKFTESGYVRVRWAVAAADAMGVSLRCEVSDSGIGISPESQSIVFQPFTQVDGSSTRRHGGTGLGLAICKQIIELMGGDIGVESELEKGSTFWFQVRLETQPVAAPITPAISPSNRADILVAEDNVINQRVATALIERRGYRADVVSNGQEALDALLRQSYALVLMDCQMPVMDGFEATREFRKRESQARRTPVIAMTAHAMSGDRERCIAAGMDDYLSKPVLPEDLDRIFERWLAAASAVQATNSPLM